MSSHDEPETCRICHVVHCDGPTHACDLFMARWPEGPTDIAVKRGLNQVMSKMATLIGEQAERITALEGEVDVVFAANKRIAAERDLLTGEVTQARKTAQFHKDNHLAAEAQVTTLTAEVERLKAEVQSRREDVETVVFGYRLRSGDKDDACQRCGGWGCRTYGSTSTWMGGWGGAAMTLGVCDACWGSGDRHHPWPSHRTLAESGRRAEKAEAEVTRLTQRWEALKAKVLQREAYHREKVASNMRAFIPAVGDNCAQVTVQHIYSDMAELETQS